MPDKLDALFQQARRTAGTQRSKQVNDGDRAASGGDKPATKQASDRDRLVLIEGKDGRLRYTLDGDEVRIGDELEVYVNADNGWLYGTFQWTGRERHAPSLRVKLGIPADPSGYSGELDATLPKHARVRRA